MLRRLWIGILFLSLNIGFAQKPNNISNWFFGYGAGLKFNLNTDGTNYVPSPLCGGKTNSNEGVSTISDDNGNLLFYTDGLAVYNKNHVALTYNGSQLSLNSSKRSTHAVVIVKKPGSNALYYIFTTGDWENGPFGLYYTLIDATLPNSLAVKEVNVVLNTTTRERVTATAHNNGKDIWIATHDGARVCPTNGKKIDAFYCYRLTKDGFEKENNKVRTYISRVGSSNCGTNAYGNLRFSSDGKYLVSTLGGWGGSPRIVEIFNFNTSYDGPSEATTFITPYDKWGNNILASSQTIYSSEFSPDNKILYTTEHNGSVIYRYDITALTMAERDLPPINSPSNANGLQLGIDGKIYVTGSNNTYLGVINNPNSKTYPDFKPFAFLLTCPGAVPKAGIGLPNSYVASYSNPLAVSFSNTDPCTNSTVAFTQSITPAPNSVEWDFGDNSQSTSFNPSHAYVASSGKYKVTLKATWNSWTKTYEAMVDFDNCCTNKITLTGTNVTVRGANNGTLQATALSTGVNDLVWDGFASSRLNETNINGVEPGKYTVKLVNRTTRECLGSASFTITEPEKIDVICTNPKGCPEVGVCVTGEKSYSYKTKLPTTYTRANLVATLNNAAATITPISEEEVEISGCVAGCPIEMKLSYNNTVLETKNTPCPVTNTCNGITLWSENITCPGKDDGKAGLTFDPAINISNFTYYWSEGKTKTDKNVDGLPEKLVNVTITDNSTNPPKICALSTNIKQPDPISVKHYFQSDNVLLEVSGGKGPYAYKWEDQTALTIKNTRANNTFTVGQTYTVTITDQNELGKCPKDYSFVFPNACTLENLDAYAEVKGQDVEIHVTGNLEGAPNYEWSHDKTYTDFFANDLPKAKYTVKVKKGSCLKVVNFELPKCADIDASNLTLTKAECPTDCNATASITLSSGLSAIWSNGALGSSVTGLCGGKNTVYVYATTNPDCKVSLDFNVEYNYKICDPKECTGQYKFTLTEGENFAPACYGEGTSLLSVIPKGGLEPIYYTWTKDGDVLNSITTPDAKFDNPKPGSYTVKARDARNCTTAVNNLTLVGPSSELKIDIKSQTPSSCLGNADGSALLEVGGGFGNYTVVWSNNATGLNLQNVGDGEHIATITDEITSTLKCVKTKRVYIKDNNNDYTLKIYNSGDDICPNKTLNLYVESKPGVTYQWTKGTDPTALSSTSNLTITTHGVYNVKATKSGCDKTASITILENNDCTEITPCEPVHMPSVELDPAKICEKEQKRLAFSRAQQRYQNYIEIARKAFRSQYIETCLDAQEKLTMDYNLKEYHYTLYYYDQAGNLVRTVPPAGVKLLSMDEISTLRTDLKAGNEPKFTEHTFETNYTYNTLNQVVTEDMPDHDRQLHWNVSTPSNTGFGTNDLISGITFTGNQTAVSIANDDKSTPPVGHIYTSADAGNTWKEVANPSVPDQNSIASHNENHLSVGDHGSVMYKLADNVDWKFGSVGADKKLVLTHLWVNVSTLKGIAMAEDNTIYTPVIGPTEIASWSVFTNSYALAGYTIIDRFVDGNQLTLLASKAGVNYVWTLDLNSGMPVWSSTEVKVKPESGVVAFGNDELLHLDTKFKKGYYATNASAPLLNGSYKTLDVIFEDISKPSPTDEVKEMAWMGKNNFWILTKKGKLFSNDPTKPILNFIAKDPVNTSITKDWFTTKSGKAVAATANAEDELAFSYYNGTQWAAITGYTPVSGDKVENLSAYEDGTDVKTTVLIKNSTNKFDFYYGNANGSVSKVTLTIENPLQNFPNEIKLAHFTDITPANPKGYILALDNADNASKQQRLYTIKTTSVVENNTTIYKYEWQLVGPTESVLELQVKSKDHALLLLENGTVWKTDNAFTSWEQVDQTRPNVFTATGLSKTTYNSVALKLDLINNNPVVHVAMSGTNGGHYTLGSGFATARKEFLPLPTLTNIAQERTNVWIAGDNGTLLTGDGNFESIPNRYTFKTNDLAFNWDGVTTPLLATNNGIYTIANNKLNVDNNKSSNKIFTRFATKGGLAYGAYVQSGNDLLAKDFSSKIDFDIKPTSALRMLTVGSSGKYLATGTAGQLYVSNATVNTQLDKQSTATIKRLYALGISPNKQELLAAGEDGTVVYSQNSGLSWRTIPTIADQLAEKISAIAFVSETQASPLTQTKALLLAETKAFWFESGSLRSAFTIPATPGTSRILSYKAGTWLVALDKQLYSLNANTLSAIGTPAATPMRAIWQTTGKDEAYVVGDGGLLLKRNINSGSFVALLKPDNTSSWVDNKDLTQVYFTDRILGYAVAKDGSVYKTLNGGASWIVDRNLGDLSTTVPATDAEVKLLAPIPYSNKLVLAGAAPGSIRKLDDQSDLFSTRHWYDLTGRAILTQNPKQKVKNPQAYSYSIFDNLNRIIEAGEVSMPIGQEWPQQPTNISYDTYLDKLKLGTRSEITNTYYDAPIDFATLVKTIPGTQKNLRNRVATATYTNGPIDPPSGGSTKIVPYNRATHYSYDIHGNVEQLWQDLGTAGLYTISYQYDLISGKVNAVNYQTGLPDAFHHRYEYDADNRLTKVSTGTHPLRVDQDAEYAYYAHGPLAKMTLGRKLGQVEECNYTYTLQGWIKAVKSDNYSYALGYHTDDYTPIGTNTIPSAPVLTGESLYNGNIATMTESNPTLDTRDLVEKFTYDPLNRLVASTASYTGSTEASYETSYKYDPNGNILNLLRSSKDNTSASDNAATIDELTYEYQKIGTRAYERNTNKLRKAYDAPDEQIGPSTNKRKEEGLPSGQEADNYDYDELGQLVADEQEEIASIEWSVYGKPLKIVRKHLANSTKQDLEFEYDAMGQRVTKTAILGNNKTITHYVRDAQGNVMAVYEETKGSVTSSLALTEHHLYGSSRLGIRKPEATSVANTEVVGNKTYELTDHLGNVHAVLPDRKEWTLGVAKASVLNAYSYFPFGMIRDHSSSDAYRYGFNGKELDNETGDYDFDARMYDPRIGRTPSPDPLAKKFPDMSPYSMFGNDPINNIDETGMELIKVIIKTKSPYIRGKLELVVDKEIAAKVKELVQYAIDNKIYVHFNSSFRTTAQQGGEIQKTGITPAPAGTSRHEGGFGLDFNLYVDNDPDKISWKNNDIDSDNPFLQKSKELGFRWGGAWGDNVHIDAWPKGEKSKYGYDRFGDAYKENQADYANKTYESEEFYPGQQKKAFDFQQFMDNLTTIRPMSTGVDRSNFRQPTTRGGKDTPKQSYKSGKNTKGRPN